MTAPSRPPSRSGFSLIELLVVVSIVGILATIAYPSYVSYLVRSNRAEAQSYLMDLANRQQQYLLDKRSYADSLTTLNAPPVPSELSRNYTVTSPFSPASTATTFKVQAVPIPTGRQKNDGTLSIDQDGNKLPSGKW
jgi:type IV pilus assembly protein PilE